jgi:hypothetical protein
MGTLGGERAEGMPAFVDALLPFEAPPEDPALSALLTIGLAAPTQPTAPPECVSTQERAALAEHTEGHATQTPNVAKMLDMNRCSVAGDSRSARDTTAAAVEEEGVFKMEEEEEEGVFTMEERKGVFKGVFKMELGHAQRGFRERERENERAFVRRNLMVAECVEHMVQPLCNLRACGGGRLEEVAQRACVAVRKALVTLSVSHVYE